MLLCCNDKEATHYHHETHTATNGLVIESLYSNYVTVQLENFIISSGLSYLMKEQKKTFDVNQLDRSKWFWLFQFVYTTQLICKLLRLKAVEIIF